MEILKVPGKKIQEKSIFLLPQLSKRFYILTILKIISFKNEKQKIFLFKVVKVILKFYVLLSSA